MARADQEKWDARYANGGIREPSGLLTSWADALPQEGRALDVAAGAGRHALWLAERGLEVTAVDVSPVGLRCAKQAASKAGLSLNTRVLDLDHEPLPEGPWDLILCVHFRLPSLFAQARDRLREGGRVFAMQPTLKNLERHAHPSARYLMEEGELRLWAAGYVIARYEEGWLSEGRHETRILAERSSA